MEAQDKIGALPPQTCRPTRWVAVHLLWGVRARELAAANRADQNNRMLPLPVGGGPEHPLPGRLR
eukprot:1124338-Pyramimonas_sp.AAC.1